MGGAAAAATAAAAPPTERGSSSSPPPSLPGESLSIAANADDGEGRGRACSWVLKLCVGFVERGRRVRGGGGGGVSVGVGGGRRAGAFLAGARARGLASPPAPSRPCAARRLRAGRAAARPPEKRARQARGRSGGGGGGGAQRRRRTAAGGRAATDGGKPNKKPGRRGRRRTSSLCPCARPGAPAPRAPAVGLPVPGRAAEHGSQGRAAQRWASGGARQRRRTAPRQQGPAGRARERKQENQGAPCEGGLGGAREARAARTPRHRAAAPPRRRRGGGAAVVFWVFELWFFVHGGEEGETAAGA